MDIVKYQIGRYPENLSGIALYCPFKKPAVLLTLPYSEENGIFPTIYWLSCPYLVKEVSRLEGEGLIKELSSSLKNNKDFREKLMNTHKRYAAKRLHLLSEEEQKKIKDKSIRMYDVLVKSGVGGIMEKDGVKCLHTHLADFLVNQDNILGEIVWEHTDWPEDCHICDKENIGKDL